MTTAIERRIAEVEAALAEIAPKPSACDEMVKAHPWFEWLDVDELTELERIYREAEDDVERMPAADQAKAMSICYAAEARMLSGAPKDSELPPKGYDLDAAYRRSEAAYRAKLARERDGE